MKILTDNGVSKVWVDDGHIFKSQPKFLTDNEWYGLDILKSSGLVPLVDRVGIELIKMELITPDPEPPVDPMWWYTIILTMIRSHDLRHGDLTRYHLLWRDGRPIVIDWAESRCLQDPRPDKRREGDEYWLRETLSNYG